MLNLFCIGKTVKDVVDLDSSNDVARYDQSFFGNKDDFQWVDIAISWCILPIYGEMSQQFVGIPAVGDWHLSFLNIKIVFEWDVPFWISILLFLE